VTEAKARASLSVLLDVTPADVDTLLAEISASRASRFVPQPRLTPSQWMEQKRVLSRENSASPGLYSFDVYPLLRKIADDFGRLDLEQVVVVKPSQVGYTELLLSLIGYSIEADPSSILLVHETLDDAKKFMKKRIKPMIRDTPALRAIFGEESGRREADDTLTFLGFPGGSLVQAGSNTAGGVSSDPIRRVFVEEICRWETGATGEGDTFKLADTRMRTFWNRMMFVGSSPGLEESCRVTKLFDQTNRQFWMVPCRDCRDPFRLEWRNAAGEYMLRCDKDDEDRWIYSTAFYPCPHCGSPYTEREKRALVNAGDWIATVPEVTDRSGFQIDGLTSPWMPWPKVMREWDEAKAMNTTRHTFINTVIGIPYAPPTERLSAEGLMARAEPMPTFPAWVGAFTVGCDLQADRGEALPVGFGPEQRFAIREPIRVYGTIDSPDFVREMADELARPRDGMKPSAVAFDTGYRPEIVWKIVDELGRRGIRAYGTKGMGEPGRPLVTKPDGASTKTKRPPWTLGTHTVKDFIDARFRVDADGPLAPAFSDQLTPEEFAQLTAEEKRLTTFKGRVRRVWVQITGRRNEMLDMLGEAIFAANALGPRFIASLGQLADSRSAPVAQPEPPPPQPQPDPVLAAILRSRRPAAPSRGFLKSGRR
jgi:terminase, large subunit